MKKIIYHIIICTIFALPVSGWGQEELTGRVIKQGLIPQNEKKYNTYTARDTIYLRPNFTSSDVAQKPFIAKIDETLIVDVEYKDPIDPDEWELDYSKPVGAIAGAVDVSPTGAATYQIPIFTPPGTAGMQPQISIVYNSQGGNGLLGIGWDIAGLSAITRTGQTVYHDGKVTAVNFDNSKDRLVLDGNRLILTNNKTYGSIGATYATEVETFSKITALDAQNGVGSCKYKVESKDGQTLEYGYTGDSRINIGSDILLWRLNKITDANKNYMRYFYGEDEQGESWIKKIEYTGNDSINQNPYATITFLYANHTDVQEAYIAGHKVKSTKLLREIKVESEGNILRRYWFNYTKIGFYSHLIEIVEEGSDGKSLNSTIIEYKPMNATGYEYNEYVVGTLGEFGEETIQAFADINGDGREDFITVRGINDVWSWHIYLATDNGYDLKFSQFENKLEESEKIRHLRVFASKPDVMGVPNIFVERHYEMSEETCGLHFYCHRFIYDRYIFDFDLTLLTSTVREFETAYGIHKVWGGVESRSPYFQTGHIYGNGVVYYLHADNESHSSSLSLKFKNTNIPSFDWEFDWKTVYKYYFIDFDGDGADELLTQTNEGIKIYKFNNGSGTPTLLHTFTYNPGNVPDYVSKAYLKFGDFNGDGKIDIMMYSDYSGSYLYVFFSTGSGFTNPYKIHGESLYFGHLDLYTGDMNGDGKDDIIYVESRRIEGATRSCVDIYYSYGDGTFKKDTFVIEEANSNVTFYPIFVSNYRGTEKLSFLIKAPNEVTQPAIHELHFNGKELHKRAVSITDGLNNKTQFEYEPLTKGGTFYAKNLGLVGIDWLFYVTNVQIPLYSVSKMIQPNGIGGTNSISFSYKGAKVNRTGKGFLGFSEITTNNAATGITTINTYMYHPLYYYVFPKETKTELHSGGITTITRAYDVYHFGNKRIMPYSTETITTDHLTNFTIKESSPTSDYDFTNGNLKQKKITYGDAVFTETTNYLYESYGNWGPKNRMTEQKTTTTHVNDGSNAKYVRKVNYVYDGKGNLTTETTDSGIKTSYSNFNAFGQPKTINVTATGVLPYSKTLQYDSKGRFVVGVTDLLGTTSQQYNAAGNLQYEIGITGQKTSYKYDGFGRVTGAKTPEGHIVTTEYGWEKINEIKSISYIKTIAPGRPTSITYYDVLSREVRSKATGYDGRMIVTDQKYNAKGQLWQTSLPYFEGGSKKWTENKYYDNGKIEKVIAHLESDLETKYNYENNTVTVTSPDGNSVTKTYNAHGDVTEIKENGKDDYVIKYKYHCSGQPKKVLMDKNQTTVVIMTYDQYGRQDTLIDPNAGTISYTYNAFGDVLTQKDARGKVTTNIYDNLRRIQTQTMTGEPTKSYLYYPSGNGKGQLKSITSSQSELHYEYGDFGRLIKMTEKIVGDQSFVTQYDYDEYGNKTIITYPGGFKVKRIYNDKGFVTEIRQADNNTLIWQRLTQNEMGQPKTYKMGNNKITTYEYDGNYLPKNVSTPGIQNFGYSINPKNGNMDWREDKLKTLKENFQYDNLNRLKIVERNKITTLSTQYYDNGNISHKSDAGTYSYEHLTKVHALTTITGVVTGSPLPNTGNQTVSYTAFHKADTINKYKDETNRRLIITYGVDQQRTRTRLYENNQLQKTKYFAANYEKEVTSEKTREINYISTPYGTLAAYIKENARGQMYYLYKDHLGSITTITDASGVVKERRSFDAWGRLRNPDNWTYNNIPAMTILDRGYTGHEHLAEFDLINMNGRLYDPIIGLMLSPDPYVSMPESMQGFNRYNYALNNPLKYTDPDGEWIHLVIGAIIGGFMNVATHANQIHNFWQGLGYFGIGAASGALGAGIGTGIQCASAGASFAAGFAGSSGGISAITSLAPGGFLWGFAATGAAAGASALITGSGNAWMGGANFGNGLWTGVKQGVVSGVAGGLVGGTLSGLNAALDGRDFWHGHQRTQTINGRDYYFYKNNNRAHNKAVKIANGNEVGTYTAEDLVSHNRKYHIVADPVSGRSTPTASFNDFSLVGDDVFLGNSTYKVTSQTHYDFDSNINLGSVEDAVLCRNNGIPVTHVNHGLGYRTTFYPSDGLALKQFIMNGTNTTTDYQYFYETINNGYRIFRLILE